jgi:hypothetical protein
MRKELTTMKRFALIFSLILVCTSALPLTALADEATFVMNDSQPQSNSVDQFPLAMYQDFQVQNKLLRQLIAQKVMYQVDETSTLNFSCNLADRSGKIELVVKF